VKILMLHQHFKTPAVGGAIRSYYLAKALVDHGHRVVVIATHNQSTKLTSNVDGIEIQYLPIPYDNRFPFYARAWSFIRYVISSCLAAAEFRDFDKCYAISTPLTVGLSARWIRFRYGMPFYFEVGDLWPDAPIELGIVRNYLLKKALFALERSIYREAAKIIALSPAIQKAVEARAPGKKVVWISNVSDCEFYFPERKDPQLIDRFQVQGKFVVSYMGAVGEANGLEYFLDCAACALKSAPQVQFILCGDGARLDALKDRAGRLQLTNLRFVDFVNRNGVKDLMRVTDVVFVCYKHLPILETGCPNKYFDGLAAGKIMVINFGGWIKKEMEENQCGMYVNPSNPVDFIDQLTPVLTNLEKQDAISKASRSLAERKYSRKLLMEEFARQF
jgi:glycosyltransferase involved in cell wall biosynthesis